MKTVTLIPLRTADGRLRYASYATEEERLQILAWAKENGASVANDAKPAPLQRIA